MPDLRLRGGEVDGLALHYVVEGRGPAVILVHGLGGFAESWRHNIGALAAQATVYAIDLPGFGRSAKPRTTYQLTYFARALHGFMDTLGLPQASLIGHSLGAAVCVTYALTHPTRVERLALLAGLVPGFPFQTSWAYRLAALRGVGEALALCGCAPLYRAAIARCFHEPVDEEVRFLVERDYAVRTSLEARAAWLATIRDIRTDFVGHCQDYRRAIASLDLPVLLVHGRQDPAVRASQCAQAADGIPRARARWIDRCGHFPHIEHAETVNRWLADFLVGRPAPR
ncbi:MAG TPA: alpha/beta fold hydrolase [Methylomirabilota bacterium]|jgi:4,5:9,10-diseco-3-hydroxy-5,9,17-trioxoandrosta-1(10),2-diene-4-oate hydrolase|nr:alpha/beta fold hydrolase [Methylomirabilota bacterium]